MVSTAGNYAMSVLLSLENVSMRYGALTDANTSDHVAFEEINLDLAAGERLGIVGSNGAGKSTLLRLMAKIFAPTSGRVKWAPGVSVSLLSLGLGFRPDLTGRENALLSCLLQGMSKTDAVISLKKIQDFSELSDFFDQSVKTYSTGMRARLGFACALMNQSSVILIDEVLSVGDRAFRLKAAAALANRMTEDRGVVIVSHSEEQINNLCNAAILLREGCGVIAGTPATVFMEYNRVSRLNP